MTLFTAMEIYAQSGSVTATVIDASTREGVPGAVVEFAPADPAAQKRYFTTGYKGRVEATVPTRFPFRFWATKRLKRS